MTAFISRTTVRLLVWIKVGPCSSASTISARAWKEHTTNAHRLLHTNSCASLADISKGTNCEAVGALNVCAAREHVCLQGAGNESAQRSEPLVGP